MKHGKDRLAIVFGLLFVVFVLLGTMLPSTAIANISHGNTLVALGGTHSYGSDGYDCDGYDRNGRDRTGYDRNGRDQDDRDRDGRDRQGYDRNGRDRQGYDRDGWDVNGRDRNGCDRDGYDRDGYNRDGWHRNGHDRNNHDKNSTSSFSIQRDSSFDAHGNINSVRVDIDTPFPIYVFLTNHEHTQCLTASQDIILAVTLIAPDGKKFVQNNIVIEQGNAYGTMDISGSYRGLWTVQVTGNSGFDPGTGNDNNGDGNGNNGNNNHSNDNNGDGNGNNGNNNHSNDNNGDGNGNNGNGYGNNGKQKITVASHFWVNKAPSSTGLLVTPETATIIKGGTQQFNATYKLHIRFFFFFDIDYDFDLTDIVDWSSSDSSVTIDNNGLARGIESGTVTITAYKDWSGIVNLLGRSDQSDTATLTVVDEKTLTGISITPASAIISANGSIQYSADLVYSDDSTQTTTDVSWASSNIQVATIDSSGLVTGKGGSQNTITITATYTANNGITYNGTSNLSVLPIFSLTPKSTTMLPNANLQFNAQLVYYDETKTDVTDSTEWVSSNTNIVTIDQNGLASSIGGGQCSISAKYTDSSGNNYTETSDLTILPILNVTPSSPTISQGASKEFSAQLQYGDGTTTDITGNLIWVSSNPSVATIDNQGIALGIAGGTSSIIVEDPVTKVSGRTVLTVLPSIVITPTEANIAPEAVQQFNVQLVYANGTTDDITNSANWDSSNPGVATIDDSGKAKGVGDGTSTITVTDPATTVSTTATLTVTTVLPTISITPASATISPGEVQAFSAQLVDANGKTDITHATWNTSNSGVATMNATSGIATGVGGGTSTITVTDQVSGVIGSAILQVRPTLSISPSSISIAAGEIHQFKAELLYADNIKTVVTDQVVWSSNNIGIATIETLGNVTGHGGGVCTITARYHDSETEWSTTETAVLTVKPRMSITPLTATISTGDNQQYSAQLVYYDGRTTDITSDLIWLSSNSNVTIDDSGLATAVSSGTCNITVTDPVTLASATTSLTVLQPTMRITPLTATISTGDSQQYSAQLEYYDGRTTDITADLTWLSSDSNVTIIDDSGLATAVSSGTCNITVTDPVTSASATTSLTVLQPVLSIIPDSTTIHLQSTQQYSAHLIYADNSSLEVTGRVTWTSSNSDVVSITSTGGLATGIAAGTSTITAYDAVSKSTKSVNITVTDAMTIIVEPVPSSTTAIFVGDKQQFSAKLKFGDGSFSDVTSSVTSWESSATSVASIDNTGLVTGVANGKSSISAIVEFNGKQYTDTYSLKVFPPKGGVILEWER